MSADSTLTDTKGVWGQQTPEIGYVGVPNTLTNRCFKLNISINYSHFSTSEQPSKCSRNSQHFVKNHFYKRPPLRFILGHINPIRHMLSHFFNILTITFHIHLSPLTVLFSSDFQSICISLLPYRPMCDTPPILSPLI